MEIRITPNAMIRVLTDSGIEPTEAKAIVLDLLMASEGVDDQNRKTILEETVRNRRDTKKSLQQNVDQPTEPVEEDPNPVENRSIKRNKRVNFSAFGGEAQPLR